VPASPVSGWLRKKEGRKGREEKRSGVYVFTHHRWLLGLGRKKKEKGGRRERKVQSPIPSSIGSSASAQGGEKKKKGHGSSPCRTACRDGKKKELRAFIPVHMLTLSCSKEGESVVLATPNDGCKRREGRERKKRTFVLGKKKGVYSAQLHYAFDHVERGGGKRGESITSLVSTAETTKRDETGLLETRGRGRHHSSPTLRL